jgi:hypothetical protein
MHRKTSLAFLGSSGAKLPIDMDRERGKNSVELERKTGDPAPCNAPATTDSLRRRKNTPASARNQPSPCKGLSANSAP